MSLERVFYVSSICLHADDSLYDPQSIVFLCLLVRLMHFMSVVHDVVFSLGCMAVLTRTGQKWLLLQLIACPGQTAAAAGKAEE